MTDNSKRQIELRRNQNILMIVGAGTLIFGVWSFVKSAGLVLIGQSETINDLRETVAAETQDPDAFSAHTVFVMIVVLIAIVLMVDLAIRIYVGRSAIAEGKGIKKSGFYIVLTGLMIIGSLLTIITSLAAMAGAIKGSSGDITGDISPSSIIIEITSLVMMIEMLIAAVRVRRLTGRGRHAKE